MPRLLGKGRQCLALQGSRERLRAESLRGKVRRGCVPPIAVFPASLFYEVVGGERAA